MRCSGASRQAGVTCELCELAIMVDLAAATVPHSSILPETLVDEAPHVILSGQEAHYVLRSIRLLDGSEACWRSEDYEIPGDPGRMTLRDLAGRSGFVPLGWGEPEDRLSSELPK